MTTIVDGHNALHREGIRTGVHENDRREILLRVREIDPDAIVYFDARGAPPGLAAGGREEGLRVRYARDGEADAAILEHVRAEPGGLVVTDDRELAGKARQLGARTLGVAEFFEELGARQAPDPEKPERGDGGFRPEDFGLGRFVNLDHPPGDLREDEP